MPIHLTPDQRKQAIQSIGRFLEEELEQDIGEMQAGFLLNYILTEIAPIAYNQGVSDARRFFDEKLQDLSGTCFEHEFNYWNEGKGKKK
ncbi:MAG: DUF2164 domain-containing protein [Verrucomicrobiaceae bacterium]|nr:MAG: DUF2164 domain-containing protein [Verrucomicrobiaceae bacterium]